MNNQQSSINNKIINIIEAEFCKFFGKLLEDEFDIQEVEEFRQAIEAAPDNYEALIYQKLGSNRKYKQFVKGLKQQAWFKETLEMSQIKPIHKFILKNDITLGTNSNLIYSMNLNPHTEWNLQKIIQQIDIVEKQNISQKMKHCKSFEELFKFIEDYFLDYCIRQLDISELISTINKIAYETPNLNSELKNILKELTGSDFIRLYAHFYNQKSYFGFILHKLSVPIPILFTAKSEKGQVEIIHPELLNTLIRQNSYCLITNIGSTKMVGKGKTNFLQKMFLLKKKLLSTSFSNLHDGSIDIYSKVPHTLKSKSILIADFHGDYLRKSKQYNQLFRKCIGSSTVILIHVTEKQMTQISEKSFINEYKQNILPLINPKTKVLLLVRDCRNIDQQQFIHQTEGLNTIKFPNLTDDQKIDEVDLKCNKVYTFLQKQTEIIDKIDTSLFLGSEALVQYKKQKSQVQKIMKILLQLFSQDKSNFYKQLFPNLDCQLQKLYLKQQTIKLEIQLRRQLDQDKTVLKKYNQDQVLLIKLQNDKTKPKSRLLTQTLQLLSKNFSSMFLLADELSAWRGRQTETFIKFIISKNAEFDNLNRKQNLKTEEKEILRNVIKDAQECLQTYDISVDTIFSELIATLQKDQQRMSTPEAQLIKRYYLQSYKSITPINLIEGKTLQFGNPFLQHFLADLHNERYVGKEIFVVSVVGAQSSAKSTILNYIFRCNFATSVGRCTKGVYLTIVQCEQKVIVVVDTEGLLSVAARDHTFDVQIACFVMLISDLVIINNKGQVDTILRDLLGVCIYAIDQLNSTEANVQYQANRVIFTIRDQIQYGGTKQQQMLSSIIKSLNQNSDVKYSKYINFTDKDIFPLQSAFVPQNQGIFCLNGANNSFGKSIIALRSRITQMLYKPKNKTLVQFYSNASRRWQAIQNCGENIFNFKSIYEIKTKQLIKKMLQQLKAKASKQYIKKQQLIISAYHKQQLQKQVEIEQQLRICYFKFKQEVLNDFNRICEQKIDQKEFIKKFHFEVEEFCTLMYKDYIVKFRKRLTQERFKVQNDSFKLNIRRYLKISYDSGKKDAQIIDQLQDQKQNLKKTLYIQMQKLQEKHNSIGRNELSLHISNRVQTFLKSYYRQVGIQYLNMEMLKDQYNKIQNYKSRRCNQLLEKFQFKVRSQRDEMSKADKQKFISIICDFINECEKTVNQLIKFQFNANIEAIQSLMLKIMEQINQDYTIFIQNVEGYCVKYGLKKLQLKHKGIILSRYISTFPIKFEKTYYEMSRSNLERRISEQEEALSQLTKQVKESLSVKGNNRETAKKWIKKIIDRELGRYFSYSQQIIYNELNQICSIINPRDIIKMAMLDSFKTSQIRSKERWLKCYKVVKNINRYLKQFLYDRVEFKELENKLKNAKLEAQVKVMNFLNDKLKQEVQSIICLKLQSTIENQDQLKGIQYYQKQFCIDLAAYKNDQFAHRLEEILLCVWGCVDCLTLGSSQYEYFKEHINYELNQKIYKLRNDVNKFTKQEIQPFVVGCQARCPGCGMKCFKIDKHVDQHSLLKDSHVMQCFNGKMFKEDGKRSDDMCFTYENIHQKYVYMGDSNKQVTVLEYIHDKHPDWYDHFLDRSKYDDKKRQKQCNIIWANIEYVIIKYKFKNMIPDKNIWKYQYDPLEEEDIINLKLQDY